MEVNLTRNNEVVGSIPGLTQWVKNPALPMCCGLGRRCSLDLALLWLWNRLAAATPIQSLDQMSPYATSAALKSKKKKKKLSPLFPLWGADGEYISIPKVRGLSKKGKDVDRETGFSRRNGKASPTC